MQDDRAGDRDIEFGMKAIEAGFVQPLHLQSALRKLNERRVLGERTSLPQILLEIGLMDKDQIKTVLGELAATVLVCTNASCGEVYKVRAFDPGRKYRCKKCKSDLRAENPEDHGEISRTVNPVELAVGGSSGGGGMPDLDALASSAPPPPPEMRGLHSPAQSDGEISVEADPRAEKGKPMSMEVSPPSMPDEGAAMSFALPDDMLPSADDHASKARGGTGLIAGVPIDHKGGTPSGDESPDSIAGVPIAGIAEQAQADVAGASGSGTTAHVAASAAKTGRKNRFKLSGGTPLESTTRRRRSEDDEGIGYVGVTQRYTRPPRKRSGGGGLKVALLILVLLGTLGGGGWFLYAELVAGSGSNNDNDTDPDANTGNGSNMSANEVSRLRGRLESASNELDALARQALPPRELIGRLDALIGATPELLTARLLHAKTSWQIGETMAARQQFQAIVGHPRFPAGIDDMRGTRAEAGFMLGLMKLLDERACDPAAARATFDQTARIDTGGDFSAAAFALATNDRSRALERARAVAGWPGLIAQALVLARGALPGETAICSAGDYRQAVDALGEGLDAPGTRPLQALHAFRGLLLGRYVDPTDPAAARREFDLALENGALVPEVAYYRAVIDAAEGRVSDARDRLVNARDLPRARLLLAELAWAAGDIGYADQLLRDVRGQLPAANSLLGRITVARGHYEEAIGMLKDASQPEDLAALGLAQILTDRMRDAADTLAAAERARAGVSERTALDAMIHARYGYVLIALNDEPESRRQFREAVAADRNSPELLYWRGRRDLEAGNPAEALRDLTALIGAHPDHWRGRLTAGKCHLTLGQTPEAVTALQGAWAHVPAAAPERDEIRQLLTELGELPTDDSPDAPDDPDTPGDNEGPDGNSGASDGPEDPDNRVDDDTRNAPSDE